MAVFHRCDRCCKEINDIFKITYRVTVTPKLKDEEINSKLKDNLDGIEFCEECAIKILKELHSPLDNPQETLGI